MEIVMWVVIILLFILSFVGVFVPLIPSVLVIWLGFVLYHFLINGTKLGGLFWVSMGTFTVLLFIVDFLMNRYFVEKFGGSRWSEWGAIIGIIIGVFVLPPFGIIFVPFVFVLVIELVLRRTLTEALIAASGAIVGFLSSSLAKIIIQFIMIGWFFIALFV